MRLALREIAPAQGRRPRPRRVSGPAQAGILEWTDRAAAIIAMAGVTAWVRSGWPAR